ncbi:MAG: sialidase family protein [Kiritimatiellales bacterium]
MSELPVADKRHITNGIPLPVDGYCDQAYLLQCQDASWVCALTTGKAREGDKGQHVLVLKSNDQGKSWHSPVALESPEGPEASYAVLYLTPYGRIYAFYNYNNSGLHEVLREDGGAWWRVDSLGQFVFRFSDDHGATWSKERYEVSVREFSCDRSNAYDGKIRFFWNVGKPFTSGASAFIPLTKVGAFGEGFYSQSEGVLIQSPNLMTETDPRQIQFGTLPEGERGLKAPPGGGRISEEHSYAVLSDGSFYAVYRTTDGWPACSYSRDQGKSWETPQYKTYTPNGKRIKHPRAANFIWKCSNGLYLYWFHNHGGSVIREMADTSPHPIPTSHQQGNPWACYFGRNPVWLSAGREVAVGGKRYIEWTQPEIALYDDDPFVRMSYPDLLEIKGEYWLTETQKTVARVHHLEKGFLNKLFTQFDSSNRVTEGLVFSCDSNQTQTGQVILPKLPVFCISNADREDGRLKELRVGVTLTFSFDFKGKAEVLLNSLNSHQAGVKVEIDARGQVRLQMGDGRRISLLDSGPDRVAADQHHALTIILDGGPKVILILLNGALCDGGDDRQYGWGYFNAHMAHLNGLGCAEISPRVDRFLLYDRALSVSESVAQHRFFGCWRK